MIDHALPPAGYGGMIIVRDSNHVTAVKGGVLTLTSGPYIH